MITCLFTFLIILTTVTTEILRHHSQTNNNASKSPWQINVRHGKTHELNSSFLWREYNNNKNNSEELHAESLVYVNNNNETDGDCKRIIFNEYKVSEYVLSNEAKSAKDVARNLAVAVSSMKQKSSINERELTSLLENSLSRERNITAMSVTMATTTLLLFRKANAMKVEKLTTFVGSENVPEMWTSPFYDCNVAKWLFGYLYSIEDSFRVGAYMDLNHIKDSIDQCDNVNKIITGEPKCDVTTTKCSPVSTSGFTPGGYSCACRDGFYLSDELDHLSRNDGGYFRGVDIETNVLYGNISSYRCTPCTELCKTCKHFTQQCSIKSHDVIRYVVLSAQTLCIVITLILTWVVFTHRKCKTIATGMWTIMEMILLGSIILYSTVLVHFLHPSVNRCLLESWCRELGFVVCYGSIILKLYRILIEFRTRKAHRWVVRDKDLLKYLLGMIIVVFGYMSAWTATNLNFIQNENYSMTTMGSTHLGLQFTACKSVWWDYVTETGEILILIFGIHLSYASRNATTQFQERRFLCIAICVEAIFSSIFYILRYLYWETLHPDFSLLAYFIRSQLTTTIVLLVLFVPKVWYEYFQLCRTTNVSRSYLMQESGRGPFEAFKPADGVTSSDVEGEINLADMNPDDIRAELKRLYTQLEILKNKTIRMDNPHISKRRGGRKIAHRRFSLQALRQQAHRHSAKQNTDVEITEAEVSRTPEDSVCSNDGPSIVINDGPSDVHGTPRRSQK